MGDGLRDFESLVERQRAFLDWCETIRDPARANTEGPRTLDVLHGAATASYEIALLPDERWAVTVRCSYECGDCHGVGISWTAFLSREQCVEFFLTSARRHFGSPVDGGRSARQQQARSEMNRLLAGGMFGFIELTPSH